MSGSRSALLVVNSTYDDEGLRRLQAPGADAAALTDVLSDGSIGGFDVRVLRDETTQVVRTAVEEFFTDRKPDDLLLLHFSCHGVKSPDGRLFLAQRDTRPKLLTSTGLPAEYVNDQMGASRAQRIALFLDCCYGGAFPRGLVGRAGEDAHIGESFRDIEDDESGRGRVVVTASSAMQYSFEAGSLATDEARPSLFTGALVEALSTGDADRDGDGWVGLTELFTFVRNQVRRIAPDQTPQMWTYGASGEILLARSRTRRVVAADLDPAVLEALHSPLPSTRLGQVDLLREWVLGEDLPTALAAWQELDKLTFDDSVKVRSAVTRVRNEAGLTVTPQGLQLDRTGAEAVLTLHGPPLARAITVTADSPDLTLDYDDHHVRVAADRHPDGTHDPREGGQALLTLTSPTGSVDVTVAIEQQTDAESAAVTVDVRPAPTPTPVPEPVPERAPERAPDGASATVSPEHLVDAEAPDRRPALPWLAAVVAACAVVAVGLFLLLGGGPDPPGSGGDNGADDADGTSADGPPTGLPQGDPLGSDEMVWVAIASGQERSIEYGVPTGPGTAVVAPEDGVLQYPSLTGDRRTIAFQRIASNDVGRIYVVGTDGEGERLLLDPDRADQCPSQGRPSWSPDGDQVATICFEEDRSRLGLGLLGVDQEVTILTRDRSVASPSWSPKGDVIVYSADAKSGADGLSSVWSIDVATQDAREHTRDHQDMFPAVDPSGRLVAFTRVEAGVGSIYVVDLTTDEVRRLTTPTAGRDLEPAWSPDGSQIAFQRGSDLGVVSREGGPVRPYSSTDGTTRRMLAWR